MESIKNPAETVTIGRELRKQNKLIKIKKEESHRRGNRNSIFGELNEEHKEKYLFLFANKDNYTSNEYEEFWSLFPEFGKLQSKQDNHYNFSGIIFPFIEQFQKDFYSAFKEKENKDYIDFSDCIFSDNVYLSSMTFKLKVIFQGAIFQKNADFHNVSFQQKADFSQVTFEGDAYFSECTFMDFVSFEDSEGKGIFDLSDVAFSCLTLDKSNFSNASYLRLDGWNKKIHEDISRERLSTKHFETKETARIIKSHFEKQNNIIESNTFYPIEMDKYREEIAEYYTSPIKAFFLDQDYFVITINKYISNYNTSWIRVLGGIIAFSLFIYLLHDGIPQSIEELLNLPHKTVELIDPLKMFKSDDAIYKDKEFWGFLARIITIYLFWQFITAFRQNTRRK